MLKDPDMKEIVDDFCKESEAIYTELEEILENYEDEPAPGHLEEFGQKIDRVMGAAKSIEAHQTGLYCELGKTISYKASQSNDKALLDIVVAVLFDTVEILQSVNSNIKKSGDEVASGCDVNTFATRLRWLADKFKNIDRSSVAIDTGSENSQESIDKLLEGLGL